MFQVEEEPEYEEPPLLPPRSADLIEEKEEEEEEQTYAECEPAPVPQEEDYEDISSFATAGLTHTLIFTTCVHCWNQRKTTDGSNYNSYKCLWSPTAGINHFLASSTAADNDYEDLCVAGQTATAIYDYQGGTSSHYSPQQLIDTSLTLYFIKLCSDSEFFLFVFV